MSMTILTQDDVFVNYDHVVSIHFLSGTYELDGNSLEAYQVIANITVFIPSVIEPEEMQQQIVLGTYLSIEECQSVAENLSEWFSNCDSRPYLFQMPQAEMPDMPSVPEGSVKTKLEYRPDET